MEPLDDRVQKIEERNRTVERDKAWETSWTRMLTIDGATYIIVVIFLALIHAPNPLITAFVPVIGFTLSTLSLPFVKKWWMSKH